MGRRANFFGAQKAITGGVIQTLTWTSSEIESAGVIEYIIGLAPAGNGLDDFTRFRMRASGATIIDCSIIALLSLQQRFVPNNTPNAATGNILNVPLFDVRAVIEDAQDLYQFPKGAEVQIELVTAATSVAGSAVIAWKSTNIEPAGYAKYLGRTLNIPASAAQAPYPFTEDGILHALTIPTLGIQIAELQVSGARAWRLPGGVFAGLAIGDILASKDFLFDGSTVLAPVTKTISIDLGVPAATGSSAIILDTSAAWVGATNEGFFYSQVAYAPAQAA